jgi:predicted GNAT family N-acyltransferase
MTYLITIADWKTRQHDLLHIRHRVFVDEQGVPIELEHDRHDRTALHLLASTAENEPIATARMLADGHVGRMAVMPAWRRLGVGSALLGELTRLAAERGIRQLTLNAQCEAESFYARLGFVAEGKVFVDAGIDHRRMRMQLRPVDG